MVLWISVWVCCYLFVLLLLFGVGCWDWWWFCLFVCLLLGWVWIYGGIIRLINSVVVDLFIFSFYDLVWDISLFCRFIVYFVSGCFVCFYNMRCLVFEFVFCSVRWFASLWVLLCWKLLFLVWMLLVVFGWFRLGLFVLGSVYDGCLLCLLLSFALLV